MEGTISLYHNNINSKLTILEDLINVMFEFLNMVDYNNTLTELNNEYKSQCIPIIVNTKENIEDLKEEYIKILESINIINNIEILYNDIKNVITNRIKKNLSISHLCRNFEKIKIKLNIVKKNIDICDICDSKTVILHEQSLLRCTNDECAKITTIITSNFDFNSNEIKPSKNKAKRHKNNEHCELWINRIQAIEDEKIPQEIIDKIIELARIEYTKNGVLRKMDNMKCSLIRQWLSNIKGAKFYNNTPSIRKIVTGHFGKAIYPPRLTEIEKYDLISEYEICIEYFMIIIHNKELLESIGKTEIKYNSYYPDILYRLMSDKLAYDQRKTRILECIKLQNEQTLIKNNKIWEMICNTSKRYKYRSIQN